MMDRAQARKLRAAQDARAEEEARRRQEDYDLEYPVRQAQAKVQVAEATNAFAGTLQNAELAAKANAEFPLLRQKWKETYDIPNEDQRLTTQEQILSDASRFSSLKAIGPEVHQWHDTWAQQLIQKKGRDMVTGRLEQEKIKQDAAKEIADLKAQTSKEIADLKAKHAEEMAAERQQRTLDAIKARGEQAVETEDSKIRTQAASKANEKVLEAGAAAVRSTSDLKRGLALLDDPEVRTGTGAGFETKVKRLAQLAGFDPKGVASTEQLQQIFGDSLMSGVLQKTKGAVSDAEMRLFDSYSASLNKSAEGNKAIMTALLRASERAVKIAKMANDMRRSGVKEADIQNAVNDYVLSHDIWEGLKVPGAEDDAGGSSSSWDDEKQKRLDELKAKLGK